MIKLYARNHSYVYTMGATSGGGIDYPSEAHDFTPGF